MHHPKKCGKPDWVSEIEVFEQRQRLLAEKILTLVTSHFLSLAHYPNMHPVQLWQVDIAEQEALEKQEQQRIATLLQAPLEAITGDALYWMMGEEEAVIRQFWVEKPWVNELCSEERQTSINSGETTAQPSNLC